MNVIYRNGRIILQRKNSRLAWLFFLCMICSSCQRDNCGVEPDICYFPTPYVIQNRPSPFPPLTSIEKTEDWGMELFLGKSFAKEMDLYRALTCFKRALFLIPRTHDRRFEIEYEIFFAYYTANKYEEAVETFEGSRLIDAPECFPAFKDLLIALYDSYMKADKPERACRVLGLIDALSPETANNLHLVEAVISADIPRIVDYGNASDSSASINDFLTTYFSESKSVAKAQVLNAILPGAGYYYVGQKKSALTSFLINTLFITAAYQLFDRGYFAAGIIVASLETGWYFGGINGAGLEAKQYNEILYGQLGKEVLSKERLFPILMLQHGF